MTAPDPLLLELQAAVAGRYAVDRELGRGGMGVVYLAQDVALLRPVAIKVLAPDLARQPEVRERFLREARTVAALSHPNIVPIHAVEEHGPLLFFVMGFIEGESLRERVQRVGPLPPRDVTALVRDIAWALGYAHGRGIVHRDVKPDNILLERATGRVLLTDFGIARRQTEQTLSGVGELVGTLQYMSPEQASDEGVDGRADLFSLGLTGLFALTGESPRRGDSAPALLAQVVQARPIPVDTLAPQAPEALRTALRALVEPQVQQRPASGEEVARALDSTTAPPIAAALRRTIEETRSAGDVLAILATGVLPLALGFFDSSPSLWLLLGLVAPASGVFSGWYTVRRRINALVRDGFRFEDLEQAVRVAHAEYREVLLSDNQHLIREMRESPRRAREWVFLGGFTAVIALIGFVMVLAGVPAPEAPAEHALRFIITLGGLLPIEHLLPRAIPWAGLGLLVGGAALIVRWGRKQLADVRAGAPQVTEAKGLTALLTKIDPARLLVSRWGRWLFTSAERAAQTAKGNRPVAAKLTSPTETIALAHIGDALAMVPANLRDRLSDVPRVAAALEAKGQLLRQRLQAADAGLSASPASHPAHEEFRRLRHGVANRLADVNAALESIRLDLLRAAAGAADAITISHELEKAKELSAAIDAELHGQDQVRKLLQ